MPHITQHPNGTPCWFELATTNQSGAKKFYGDLFGWKPDDFPIGPDQFYTMFKIGSDDVGAAYTLMPDMVQQGIPPHWLVYFDTQNADETSAKVTQLGGSIIKGPFDVMEHGRMAICRDPGDAVFAIWQAKQHIGATVNNEPGSVCWTELVTRAAPRVRDFYTGLFGWHTTGAANMPSYLEIAVDGNRFGGIMPMDDQWQGIPAHWGVYFMTSDCDVSAAKAKELGATVLNGPFTAEGVGRMAMLRDPQGAHFSLYAPPSK